MADSAVSNRRSTQQQSLFQPPKTSPNDSRPLMKAIALSVWLFLNLGFFGMCGYIYLIWAQNWRSNTRELYELHPKSLYDPKDPVIFYEPPGKGEVKQETPRTKVAKKRKKLECDGVFCEDLIDNKLVALKNDVLLKMRRVLHDESSVFKTDNPYHVLYRGPRGSLARRSGKEVMCRLQKAGLRTLNRLDAPFSDLPIGDLLGGGDFFREQHFHSCAVVTNAASLEGSNSGAAIDNHDLVVRFNHAPTTGYEADVGSKTDVRIVNSQVVTKEKYAFTTNELFKNLTVVVWDPSDYAATLEQWYQKPDFDFFTEWAKYKQANPSSSSVVLDPRSVWRVWDFVQSLTALRIRRNPPSSGFLGLAMMLPLCDYVDVFEFVPSIRMTTKCHYFDNFHDASCTFGVWHPLAAEKFITLAMNEVDDSTVFEQGFVRIPGYRDLSC